MVDMESNQVLPLTSYEAALLATVVDGQVAVEKEPVIYLHRENTPKRTARASILDLETDETQPLSLKDAEKIAAVVRHIEEIEASSYSDMIKSQLRRNVEPNIMGKPLWRNLI